MKGPALSILLLVIFNCHNSDAAVANLEVKELALCNKTQSPITIIGNITKERGGQYLYLDLITPLDWDENIGGMATIQSKVLGSFRDVIAVREKYLCKAANAYLGELWLEIEKSAGIKRGVCPLAKGRYHANHHKLDYTKLAYQTLPIGNLKVFIRAVDKRNSNNELFCISLTVDNKL